MKIKKEYIFLLAIIAGLGLYLYMHNSDQTNYQLPDLGSIEMAKITKLEIIKPSETIVLNRKGSQWLIGEKAYPADFDKVQNLLKVVDELTLDTLVSEAKSYSRFDLTPEKRITVKAFRGDKKVREFDLGKAAATYRHTYVKLADDPKVYHARNNFRSKFDVSVDDLRNKSVLTFDKTTIDEITISQASHQAVFKLQAGPLDLDVSKDKDAEASAPSPAGDVWMREDSKKADSAKIKDILDTLSDLTCDAYINDRTKDAFKEPIHTVDVKGSEEFSLSIFKQQDSDKKDYPAISSACDYPFLLPKWKVKKIMKEPDELLAKVEEKKEK